MCSNGPAARAGVAPGQLLVSLDGTPAIPPALPAFRFGQDHQVTTKLPGQQETRNIAIAQLQQLKPAVTVLVVVPGQASGALFPHSESVSHSWRIFAADSA
jgi:hypothetical protein